MRNPDKKTFRWYFDFISPFAYLQFTRLREEIANRDDLVIEYCPILFAGLLKHFEHKGPAEIPAKRQMTYRFCHWYALKHGIEFHMPAAHPFNPLPLLRLALAHHGDAHVIEKLFQHVWVDSASNEAFSSVDELAALPGLDNAVELIADPEVKARLKTSTENAIAKGIFGVPTIEIEDQLFWGMDMTEMAFEYLDYRDRVTTEEYLRLGSLPVAKGR